jgi:hypothetical protein
MQADSPLREAITQACHAIEQRLSTDPHHEGESRSGERRVTFEAPIIVVFRIEADDRTVTVLRIGVFHRKAS